MKNATYFLIAFVFTACGGSGDSSESTETTPAQSMYESDHSVGLIEKANNFFTPIPEVATSESNLITKEKVYDTKKLIEERKESMQSE